MPIEAELAEVDRHLATFVDDLESSDAERWEAAIVATEPLVLSRNALLGNLQRWNEHVATLNGLAAAKVVADIDQMVADADLIRRLHAHFAAYAKTVTAEATGEPANPSQLALVRAFADRHGVPVPVVATVEQMHAWLCAQPESNRTPLSPAYPAFTWHDRYDHAVQVRSLIEIEREQLALIGELAAIRPRLKERLDPQDLAVALEESRALLRRLSILQGDAVRWSAHVGDIRRQGARDRANEIRRSKS